MSSDLQYKLIVGLEIHVQLCTKSKMFCGCAVEFGQKPNSRVCPVCLGMPGVLPVMNKKAFDYSVLVGLALNCEIAQFTNGRIRTDELSHENYISTENMLENKGGVCSASSLP
ncbi:MAG: hypothetical protein RQ760_20405, partial [Sedimentisphaerales bacterium]|nr:hypothetical protein [Sedimentisphaerales bacterium]